MNTDLTDPPDLLTSQAADYLGGQLNQVLAEAERMRGKRAAMLAEIPALDEVIRSLEEAAEVFRRRLNHAVSMPPLGDLAGEEPEQELPLEAAAHKAVVEQAALVEESRAGGHPYGPSGTRALPRVDGHVQVNGAHDSSELRERGVRS